MNTSLPWVQQAFTAPSPARHPIGDFVAVIQMVETGDLAAVIQTVETWKCGFDSRRRLQKRRNSVNKINLLKNNVKENRGDVEWMQEFFDFLQGDVPEGVYLHNTLTMTQDEAFSIIYYLQEHLPIFPDYIEVCNNCGELYNSESEGSHGYCGDC